MQVDRRWVWLNIGYEYQVLKVTTNTGPSPKLELPKYIFLWSGSLPNDCFQEMSSEFWVHNFFPIQVVCLNFHSVQRLFKLKV
jgi:hypothetical protein